MNYNDELQALIEKASKDGYEFFNGKFEKSEEKFPVMEMYLVDNSVYESTGYYHIFKKTYKIENEDFEKIKEFADNNDGKSFLCNCSEENSMCEIIKEIIYKYDDVSNTDFLNTNIGGYISVNYTEYYRYSEDGDDCVDLWLTKKNDDCDFPRGFISFYEMTIEDFKQSDNVDLHLEKFMRDN